MPDKYTISVLVVDDDLLIVDTFKRAFAPHPEYWIEFADTIEKGIAQVREKRFDYIFLDMKINGHTHGGMTVLRELATLEQQAVIYRQAPVDSIVVIMTGSIHIQSIMPEAHALGVICFMDKPVAFTKEFVQHMMRKLKILMLPPRTEEPPMEEPPQ